jgi:F-type H+-transporting ATPase subunit a
MFYLNNLEIIKNPLDQFEIRDLLKLNGAILGDFNISLTNMVLYLIISASIIIMFNSLINYNKKIVVNNWVLTKESFYDTIFGIVISQINKFNGQSYFPFMYVLFMFILINNLIGLVPYSFSTTAHVVLTFALSFTIVLGATILGFYRHNLKFFALFVPAGCPLALLPVIILIEFISYLTRNISLGLRLGANIISGHMLLYILSGFTYNIMTSSVLYFFVGLLPLTFIIAFSGLELGIAFIQAQGFVVLSCSYIKDGLDLH